MESEIPSIHAFLEKRLSSGVPADVLTEALAKDHRTASPQRRRTASGSGASAQHYQVNVRAGEVPAVTWDGSRLYWFDEAPPALQFNPYVKSGYRAGMTVPQCCRSIFQYHNETGNVLVHLIPVLLTLCGLALGLLKPWPAATTAFWETVIPILLCLTGSVVYHTCMADHKNYKRYLFTDVCGVFALFLSGVHALLWWGLLCHPTLRAAFMWAYYGTAALCVVVGVTAESRTTRAAPMLLLLCVRLAAVVTRLCIKSGSHTAALHYLAMEVLSAAGATINILRVPEKWFHSPNHRTHGRFDYWFNSHQVMHILVAWAMLHYFYGATADYQYYVSNHNCSLSAVH
jgi:predicted membrane channel-forming protein YqfA (hemolysin III family)